MNGKERRELVREREKEKANQRERENFHWPILFKNLKFKLLNGENFPFTPSLKLGFYILPSLKKFHYQNLDYKH